MFIKSATFVLGALALGALQPALAESSRTHIRNDIQEVREDRATVRADEIRLAKERAEFAAARVHRQDDLGTGHFIRAIRDGREVRHEAADVRAAEAKLANDRAKLARDSRDLHEDLEHRHHHHE